MMGILSENLIGMRYFVGEDQMNMVQQVLEESIMTQNNYRTVDQIETEKTVALPMLSEKESDLRDKSGLMNGLQEMLNECQPIKLVE